MNYKKCSNCSGYSVPSKKHCGNCGQPFPTLSKCGKKIITNSKKSKSSTKKVDKQRKSEYDKKERAKHKDDKGKVRYSPKEGSVLISYMPTNQEE